MESKLDGQTDAHSDYSVQLRVVSNFDTKALEYIVVIDNFDLHIFYLFHIDFMIFGGVLPAASPPFCIPVAGQCCNK